jgi:hypothetical protein
MIRLTDEQWERIRKLFPEELIADGEARPEADWDAAGSGSHLLDYEYGRAVARAAAVLSDASKIRHQTLLALHRLKRRNTLFQFPNASGRSRQGDPYERSTAHLSTNIRLSRPLEPFC